MPIAVNLMAQTVLLPGNLKAFASCQMTVMCRAIKANFAVNASFAAFQMGRLRGIKPAAANAVRNAVLLIFTALIDLRETGGCQRARKKKCQKCVFHFGCLAFHIYKRLILHRVDPTAVKVNSLSIP